MTLDEFIKRYTENLNEQQQEAVRAVDGAVLLLAVPGSGKTTVLVTRLGYMVCYSNIPPESILTMTYTVAATEEMKQRFSKLFGNQYAEAMEFRTINGVSAKIIDYYGRFYARERPFPIIENSEAVKAIGQIYLQIKKEYPTESTIKDIRTGITYIKNMMLTDEEIEKLDVGVENMPQIYQQYCLFLNRRRLMDFDDQMVYAYAILKNNKDVLNYFQEKFRYICVDESQDTSKIQHVIIELLARKYGNIFMVGDEDQSIYGFRAAYPEALMNFSDTYPNAKVLLLEKNYRSTDEIVAAANAFVSKNQFRYEKVIQATRGSGLPIQLIRAKDRTAQFKYIFAVARNCKEETAVLYRNNDTALPLIDMLERSGIQYNCRNFDDVFFTHKVVNDITDIINFAYDPYNTDIFMRIYYKFDSPIPKKAAVYACEQTLKTGKPILEELIHCPELKVYTKDAVIDLFIAFPKIIEVDTETALMHIWRNLKYGNYVRDKNLDAGKFDILCMIGRNTENPQGLLQRLNELRSIIQTHQNSPNAKFLLSTIHSSKGLEYDRVYLIDIFDGFFPNKSSLETKKKEEVRQHEEERRLYYVGMTRAKNELHIFDCADNKSCFTSEIAKSMPQEKIDEEDIFAVFKNDLRGKSYTDKVLGKGTIIAQCGEKVLVEYETQETQLLSVAQMFENRDTTIEYTVPIMQSKIAIEHTTAENIKVGTRVEHKSFGLGTVVSLANNATDVQFDGSNVTKRFMLSVCLKKGLLKVKI